MMTKQEKKRNGKIRGKSKESKEKFTVKQLPDLKRKRTEWRNQLEGKMCLHGLVKAKRV